MVGVARELCFAKAKENNFKENIKNKDDFNKIMDSTYLKATWKAERAAKFGNKEIFNLGGKSYTQNDFAKFLDRVYDLEKER